LWELPLQRFTKAYRTVANQISNPREIEANLLLHAASRLRAVVDGWDVTKADLNEALLYNRKLWTIILGSVTASDNPLPSNIRQNVANLGIFVINQTLSTLANPRPEPLGSLININRELAAGLLGRA
jgi:flagellar biosynthesis activator protein FlaF